MSRAPMRWMFLFSLAIVGCTGDDVPLGTTTSDTGVADTAVADTRVDTTVDASPDTARETSVTDTAADAPLDASAVSATISAEYLFQSCMPIVPTDPVRVKATVALDNPTAVSFGTLRASSGRFVSGTGSVTVATFAFPEIALTLPPLSSTRETFEKTADSVEPKASCGTLPCGATVRIEVVLTGPTASITARSGEITVECAY